MKRSQLEKIRWKTLTKKSLKAYKKQKNYISRLCNKERKMLFDSLNSSFVSDNRKIMQNFFFQINETMVTK